jgi:hypothetical protein
MLRGIGVDVATVANQDLAGAGDDTLIEICRIENRCLVTLDLDFSNPLCYDPARYAGIVVFRLPKNPCHQDLLDLVHTLIAGISLVDSLRGKLWVVARSTSKRPLPDPRSRLLSRGCSI